MALQNQSYADINIILSMHKSCISSWKQKFVTQGLAGIKLAYKGAKSYLAPTQRAEVIGWLKAKNYWDLEELASYVDEQYSVIYQSPAKLLRKALRGNLPPQDFTIYLIRRGLAGKNHKKSTQS